MSVINDFSLLTCSNSFDLRMLASRIIQLLQMDSQCHSHCPWPSNSFWPNKMRPPLHSKLLLHIWSTLARKRLPIWSLACHSIMVCLGEFIRRISSLSKDLNREGHWRLRNRLQRTNRIKWVLEEYLIIICIYLFNRQNSL